nr:MAG TPA: hypothetical protein [Caudoviricetes sp.]DAM52297.1 MAG TPA: hypothetical protein [Bacteriophage sp.]
METEGHRGGLGHGSGDPANRSRANEGGDPWRIARSCR